jgi:hypothetical protein
LYNVAFALYHAAVTAAPQLSLPARWTYRGARFGLAAGRYRWIVRPGFGGVSKHAYGREIVHSTFVARAPPGFPTARPHDELRRAL